MKQSSNTIIKSDFEVTPEIQQKIFFSILEDADEAKRNLEKRVSELNILREMGERIGYALDFKTGLDIISTSLAKILDYSTVSYMLFGAEGTTFNVYLDEQVSSNFVKEVKEKMTEALKGLGAGESAAVAATETKFKANIFGKKIDEQKKASVASFFNVPLTVGEEVIGMLNVASSKPDVYREEEIRVLYTIASQASTTIARLTERTSTLIESLSNGVVMFNLEHRIIIANPAAKQMLDLPEEKFTLLEIAKIFEKINLYERIEKSLKTGETEIVEEAEVQNRIYEIIISSVKDYKKEIIGGSMVLHDVTHRREIERAKTEFISIASHQLRTPLAAIKLFVEMLTTEEVGELNKDQKEYMDNVQQSTERMIKLVNDLLNVSRLETGRLKIEPKLTQLEDFIQGIIDEADPLAASHKCKIVFKKPKEKLPKIPIDPSLMRQVFHNLIMNAIRYSPVKQCDILVKLETKNNDYIIIVKDGGIGIPKKDQSRIFEKFFRSDNARKVESEGSGLGLYVVKMIVEASDGRIWFESGGAGKGTTFYVSLPTGGMKKKKGEKGLAGE